MVSGEKQSDTIKNCRSGQLGMEGVESWPGRKDNAGSYTEFGELGCQDCHSKSGTSVHLFGSKSEELFIPKGRLSG